MNTPIKKVWSRIGALKNSQSSHVSMLKVDNNVIDGSKDIANTLAKNMSDISSFKNRSENFVKHKNENKIDVDFFSEEVKDYNFSITIRELSDVIKNSGNTATGTDKVHYLMLKNLTHPNLEYIRSFYNIIFLKDFFPKAWREALVIPILKPDKDPKDPNSFRPISLLSCLCKILEKIVNKRLMWFLERNNLLDKCQCGFRKGRCTIDHLTTITTEIQEAFVQRKYHVSVFLDLEKAYDTCWKQHVLQEVKSYNMIGHLPIFIQNFLKNRSIRVSVNCEESEPHYLEMGVPQGSSLSVTLFLIAINSITKNLSRNIRKSLFVDDSRISIITDNLADAAEYLQKALDVLQKWGDKTGFRFSETKSKVLICDRKRVVNPAVTLTLNGQILPMVKEFKFLGVIFDSKLTWRSHIKMLKEKCIRKANLLKIIAGSKFKTNSKILLNIYKAMVLPKLEYGSQAYHTAAPTTLQALDPVHHLCLRICLGAFRTTPIESLYIESSIPSLEERRKILSMQYYFRSMKIGQEHISTNIRISNKDILFNNQKKIRSPIGLKVRNCLTEFEIGTPKIIVHKPLGIPPWFIPNIEVCFHLNETSKSSFSIEALKQKFYSHKHSSRIDIYTDGSKTDVGTGAGVAIYNSSDESVIKWKIKLNKLASVYSAELEAIKSGLTSLLRVKNTSCTLYSDSKSALQALSQYDPKNELVQDIQIQLGKIKQNNTILNFCWVPGHCNIAGNEAADKMAKTAANITRLCLKPIVAEDMKPHIKKQVFTKWRERWNEINLNKVHLNKLRQIEPCIGNKDFSGFESRIEEIKFTRIRLGHTRFSNSYHFNVETRNTPPVCDTCEVIWTIPHILLVCPRYYRERIKFFGNGILSLAHILDRSNRKVNRTVISFLKEVKIFSEI